LGFQHRKYKTVGLSSRTFQQKFNSVVTNLTVIFIHTAWFKNNCPNGPLHQDFASSAEEIHAISSSFIKEKINLSFTLSPCSFIRCLHCQSVILHITTCTSYSATISKCHIYK
jgi:hypothetical protein